jgi:hypothetical protein
MANWFINLFKNLIFGIKKDLNNFGFIHVDPRDTDWVTGAETGITYKVNVPDGDWSPFKPAVSAIQTIPLVPPVNGATKTDTNACTCFSVANVFMTIGNWMLSAGLISADNIKALTDLGIIVNGKFSISANFIALIANNDPAHGDNLLAVIDACRKIGLVGQSAFPMGTTIQQFYDKTRLTPDVLAKAKLFLNIFQINYEWVSANDSCAPDISVLQYHLKQSPLWVATTFCPGWFTQVPVPNCKVCRGDHATEIYCIENNAMLDFDSESTSPRQFALDYPIVAAMKVVLQPVVSAPVSPIVKHTFLKDIELGDRNPEVVFLQDRLKQLGYFPLNVASTGFYGNITKTAVAAFQKANGIRPSQPGVYCYILTRTALNK